MRKVPEYVGTVLLAIGMLILIGSVIAFYLGPEMLLAMDERTKPLVPFILAGLGLIVLGYLLSPGPRKPPNAVTSGMNPDPSVRSEGTIRCGKCDAVNDDQARFCNQCEVVVFGHK